MGTGRPHHRRNKSITVVSPPGAPTGLTASASDAQVALSWLGPTNNGGSPLTLYNIYEGTSPGGETLLTSISAVCSGVGCGKVQSFVATGLTNGTTYYFEVTAVNSVGESSPSNEVSATPATLPGAPTGLAAAPGNTQVALSWTAPPSNGGSAITSYNVYEGTSSGGETLLQSTGSSATTFTATGLTNGTQYYFEVTAVNWRRRGPGVDRGLGHPGHRAGGADGAHGYGQRHPGGSDAGPHPRTTAGSRSLPTTSTRGPRPGVRRSSRTPPRPPQRSRRPGSRTGPPITSR